MSDCPDCRCKNFEKCFRILNLILDNEASHEEESFFYGHIEKCMICFGHYNLECQIRQLLKTKIAREPVPSNLFSEIKSNIIG